MILRLKMEAKSPMVSLNSPKDIGENRKRANDDCTRQQFYRSDRVKRLHRGLLLMETINDRRLQQERKTADLEAQRARQRNQMELQKDYREQMARLQSDREKQNQEEALAEKGRQQWVREKDEWKRINDSKMAEKLQRRQQKIEVGLEMFAAQERLRKEAEDLMIAKASANREVSAKQVCSRRHNKMVTPMDLKDHHESVQRERQLRVEEERKSRKDTLALNKEADAAFWEGERVAARTRREARMAMDTVLIQQMEEKRLQDRLRKNYELDFEIRSCWRTRTHSSRRMRKGSSTRK